LIDDIVLNGVARGTRLKTDAKPISSRAGFVSYDVVRDLNGPACRRIDINAKPARISAINVVALGDDVATDGRCAARNQKSDGVMNEQIVRDNATIPYLCAVAGGVGRDVVYEGGGTVGRLDIDIVVEDGGTGSGNGGIPPL
jgi:hypothetical protein